MRKLLLSLILSAAALLCCRAQDLQLWKDGPASFTGFQIAPADDSLNFKASYTIARKWKHVRGRDATYHYLDFTGAIIPYMSRVKADAMTPETLKKIQQEFDMLEYFARQFRDDLLYTKDWKSVRQGDYVSRFMTALATASATGDYEPYALPRGEFDVTTIPYEASPTFTGISVGLFADQPFGDQARLLTPTAGISLGVDRGRGPGSFGARAQVGISFLRKRYLDLRQPFVIYFDVFGLYRREVLASGKMHLSVQGGPGIAARLFEANGENFLVGGPALDEGLILDLYSGRAVALSNGHPEQSDRFWRFTLSCNQLYNIRQNKVFPALNLSAGLWFQSRSITRR
jgi:hypothetical protein